MFGGREGNLLAATQTEHQVQGRFLLDVVIAQSAAILQLLAGKDQTLLIRRNALLVLNLGLDIVNGVGRLNLGRDSLAGHCGRSAGGVRGKSDFGLTGLDEDLHDDCRGSM